MRRLVPLVICAALVTSTAALAGSSLPVAALTRVAGKLSGLRVKSSPKVVVVTRAGMRAQALRVLDRDYPRASQTYDEALYRALGLLADGASLRPLLEQHASETIGLYDPLRKTVYARSGTMLRRTILRELVHSLQDQNFDLRRLPAIRRSGRDAALATIGTVDGHAAFVTRVFRSPAAPRTDASRIDSFLRLEDAFADATGVRFAATLNNVGGRRAIFTALNRFPTTTEQLFHVDAFLSREPAVPVALPSVVGRFGREGEDTFGELDVRALLAVFSVPRLAQVGTGWGGGRTALYRDANGRVAVVVALAWDEELDAAEWKEAVATYVNKAFASDRPGPPPPTACAATVCWDTGARTIAFARAGRQTALVFGPTVADAARIALELVGS